jgi:hypothetical protein
MPNFIVEFLTAIVFGFGVSVGVFIAGVVILIACQVFYGRKR